MIRTRKYYLSTLLLLTLVSAYSQPLPKTQHTNSAVKEIPSLTVEEKLSVAVESKAWSEAALYCLQLGSLNHRKLQFDLAIVQYLKGVDYSQKAGNVNSEAENLLGLGSAHYAKFNYPVAMEYCVKALKYSSTLDNPQLTMRINNRIGMIYKYLEDYDKAMEYFVPAYKEALRLKKGPIVDLLINIGNVEEARGNYRESIGYYEKYLELHPTDRFTQVIAYNNIATVYIKLKQLDKASALFMKAYQVEDTIDNPQGRAYSFFDFATLAQAKGDYKQAIDYELHALKLAEPYKIKSLEWKGYHLLADCYEKTGNYKLANEYLKKFTALRDSIFAKKSVDKINVLNAAYRIELETEKKQREILSLNKENSLKKLQVIKLQDENKISGLKVANLNNEKSLTRLQLHNLRQKDSLSQLKLQNYNKAILVNNMKVQSLSQQNQLKNLQLSLQRRNQMLIIIATGLFILAFIFYYRRYRFKKLVELHQLRSNIAADFHDEIGSTLSSIALYSDMALWDNSADNHRIKNTLSLIGESSRSTVSAMQDMVWALQPKNDTMNEIIFRMKEYAIPLAEHKNISLTLQVDEEVKHLQTSMTARKNMYMIFKEAVNNAFKYSSATNIDIKLAKENNFISLKIQDNGVGFDPLHSRAGNGLRNMHKRADQSGGTVNIESFPEKGTEIRFTCAAN